jgi:hypothetical protein
LLSGILARHTTAVKRQVGQPDQPLMAVRGAAPGPKPRRRPPRLTSTSSGRGGDRLGWGRARTLPRLGTANEAYDGALAVADELSRRRIANKYHRRGEIVRGGAKLAYYEHGTGEPTLLLLAPLVYGIATFQVPARAVVSGGRSVGVGRRDQGAWPAA